MHKHIYQCKYINKSTHLGIHPGSVVTKKKAVNAGAFECVHTGCKVLLRYLHFTDASRLHEQQSYIKYSHISCLD